MDKNQNITEGLINEFREWIVLSMSPETVYSYISTLRKYCMGKTIAEVNCKEFFIQFSVTAKQNGFTINTVARHTYAVKKFLEFLYSWHNLSVINLSLIKCRRSPRTNPTYLEKSEIAAIRQVPVRTITQLRDRALFEFLLDTGCRISEVLGIDWTTIDLEKGEVKIMGKGSKQRTVFLNESKEWILEYLEHRGSDAKALFLSQYKVRPLNRGNAAVAIRELGKKAGIKQVVHPHLVRHTFGTYLIWAGVNPRTVQDMMGHSYLETTLRYYSAVTKEHMKQALFLMQFIEVLDEEYEMNFDAELKSFSDDFKMFQTKNPSVLTSDESNEN